MGEEEEEGPDESATSEPRSLKVRGQSSRCRLTLFAWHCAASRLSASRVDLHPGPARRLKPAKSGNHQLQSRRPARPSPPPALFTGILGSWSTGRRLTARAPPAFRSASRPAGRNPGASACARHAGSRCSSRIKRAPVRRSASEGINPHARLLSTASRTQNAAWGYSAIEVKDRRRIPAVKRPRAGTPPSAFLSCFAGAGSIDVGITNLTARAVARRRVRRRNRAVHAAAGNLNDGVVVTKAARVVHAALIVAPAFPPARRSAQEAPVPQRAAGDRACSMVSWWWSRCMQDHLDGATPTSACSAPLETATSQRAGACLRRSPSVAARVTSPRHRAKESSPTSRTRGLTPSPTPDAGVRQRKFDPPSHNMNGWRGAGAGRKIVVPRLGLERFAPKTTCRRGLVFAGDMLPVDGS